MTRLDHECDHCGAPSPLASFCSDQCAVDSGYMIECDGCGRLNRTGDLCEWCDRDMIAQRLEDLYREVCCADG